VRARMKAMNRLMVHSCAFTKRIHTPRRNPHSDVVLHYAPERKWSAEEGEGPVSWFAATEGVGRTGRWRRRLHTGTHNGTRRDLRVVPSFTRGPALR